MTIAVNFPIYVIGKKKPEKNQGFNGIRTRDLRDTGAMLYQLSYEATHWERGHVFSGFFFLDILGYDIQINEKIDNVANHKRSYKFR